MEAYDGSHWHFLKSGREIIITWSKVADIEDNNHRALLSTRAYTNIFQKKQVRNISGIICRLKNYDHFDIDQFEFGAIKRMREMNLKQFLIDIPCILNLDAG